MTFFEHIKSTFAKDHGKIDMPPSFLLWSIVAIIVVLGQSYTQSLTFRHTLTYDRIMIDSSRGHCIIDVAAFYLTF